jgi:hypothetical protein
MDMAKAGRTSEWGWKDDLWYVPATIPNGCLEPVAIPSSWLDKGLAHGCP